MESRETKNGRERRRGLAAGSPTDTAFCFQAGSFYRRTRLATSALVGLPETRGLAPAALGVRLSMSANPGFPAEQVLPGQAREPRDFQAGLS